MARRWVVNASPVILLAKIGRQSFLEELATELVIPAGVAEEIREGPEDDPGYAWLSGLEAGRIRSVIQRKGNRMRPSRAAC